MRLDKRTTPPYAAVVQTIWRPDGGISQLRGNIQNLPNGNKFIGWSDNAYITEHAPDGQILMSASFASERAVTYRAYKFPFEGFPHEKPVMHAAAYRAGSSSITTYFVSWNGATNVVLWRFWRAAADSNAAPTAIGETQRTGFETSFQSPGCETLVFAEGLDYEGISLGKTERFAVIAPPCCRKSDWCRHSSKAYGKWCSARQG